MFFRVLFYAFLIYLFYRLVFHFIIPIYKTTQQVKKGFRQMNEQMNQTYNGSTAAAEPQQAEGGNKGEYIDFEEIK
jgi:hypothetical protein